MTTVADAEHTATAERTNVAGQAPPQQLLHVDPHLLGFEDNVRTDADVTLTEEFINSIGEYGVLEPVLGRVRDDGTVLVRDGQRRVLGARAVAPAGTLTVPVYVRDTDSAKKQRILEQINANEHGERLTDADLAAAWEQLALEGMSAAMIARKTGTDRETVEAGLVVARHHTAMSAVRERNLTLEQAAALAEFADDSDAVARLEETAAIRPGAFDHVAQQLRDEKATREEIAALRTQFEARGVRVVDWPRWDDQDIAFLEDLQTADGEPLTAEGYTDKPGYAVAIGDGHDGVTIGHVVVDWRKHGLRRTRPTGAVRGKMTDAEKTQRKLVITNNKAWDSAETVRRRWLKDLLGRKRLPKDALAFATVTLATEPHVVGRAVQDDHSMAHTLLGYERSFRAQPLAALVDKHPTKATHVILAVALGALEAATGRHTWRSSSDTARRYVRQLKDWGYGLAKVEELVIADPDGDATGTRPTGQAGDAPETSGQEAASDVTEATTPAPAEATVEDAETAAGGSFRSSNGGPENSTSPGKPGDDAADNPEVKTHRGAA